MALEDALARIPGLAGYLGQEQFTQRQNAGQMQQLSQAQTLQKHFQEQQRERGLREALAGLRPDATDEEKSAAITPYLGADKMFGAIEARKGREITARNTREIAMSRLAQQASQFARSATTSEQRLAVDTWYKKGTAAIAEGRAFHELPDDISKAAGVGFGPAPVAPQQAPAAAPVAPVAPSAFPRAEVRPGAARGGDPAPIRGPEFSEEAQNANLGSPESLAELQRELGRKDLQPRARAILEAELARITQAASAPVEATQPPATPVAMNVGAPDAANLDSRDLRYRGGEVPPPPVAPVPPQGAPVARGEPMPAPGAPVARGIPEVPKETMDKWVQLHGRKKAGMMAAQWQVEQVRGVGREVPGDFTKRGAEYLDSLPVSDRALVKKIANYEVDPKTLETRGGQRSRMLAMVSQYDPKYDQPEYANKSRAIGLFGSGPLGNTTRSINVAIEHMDTLQRAADAMRNGTFTPANKAYNEVAKILGEEPPNTFEAMRDIVANEVVKGTIGTAGAVEDRSQAAAKIKASASPEQFKKLIEGWTELMGGQVKGLERQYEGSTKLKDYRERYLTPRAIAAIALAESRAGGASSSSTGNSRSVTVGGKTYNFPTPAAAAEFKRKAGIQ